MPKEPDRPADKPAPDATEPQASGVTLDGLRKAIRDVDREILDRVARRTRLAQTIGEEKRKRNLPIQDFRVEKQVVDTARAACKELGIDERLGDEVMRPLIRHAVRVQEKDRVRGRQATGGKRILIVGGAGLMGHWFADFLASQGHTITILDPKGQVAGYAYATEVEDAALGAEVIIVATPPSVTSSILDDIGMSGTKAVIFDICSLKTPVKGSLESLSERGLQVCSIHPMFGPETDLLSNRHVVICPLGDDKAVQTVRGFFADTCATLVEMSLDEHDHLVSYVLGLSHAINIMFNDVLARSGRSLDALRQVSSTTFENQVRVAGQLAKENPDLYYEIQALNRYTPPILESIQTAITILSRHVAGKNRDGFVQLMNAAHGFYEAAEPKTDPPTAAAIAGGGTSTAPPGGSSKPVGGKPGGRSGNGGHEKGDSKGGGKSP